MNLKTIITMHRYTYALIIVTSLILIGTIINNASAYTIDLNNHSVWVEGSYGKLEATPHTLSQSGWVYFNITPYQDVGNIDMVWGFNTSEVKPKKAEFYKPHIVHWNTNHKRFFWNVSKIKFTTDDCCYGNEYNIYKRKVTYQTGYDNVTNESIITTETVCFDSYIHNSSNYTVYWTTDHSQIENWIDVSNKLYSVNYNYDNKTKWWYVTDFTVEPYKTYTGRVWLDVSVTLTGVSGKYDFAVKRSSDSLHDAISNHRFYLLDPWFNSSWSTKRNLNINWNIASSSTELNNPTEDGYILQNNKYNEPEYIYMGCSDITANKIYRGYVEWDISSIPDDAIITHVKFKYHGKANFADAHITQMVCKPSISSNQTIYDDIGNGTIYIDQDGFPIVDNNQEINLGSNAASDLQDSLSSDWFAIGLQGDIEDASGNTATIYSEDYSSANPKPTLYIEYTSESLNYYQMNLNLSYSDIPEAQNDFDDIRFVNITDGTSLPYWIEDRVNGSWCNVWVNVTSLYAGWNNDTVALYYENGEATSISDGDATFNFFDNFSGDLSKYTGGGANAQINVGNLELSDNLSPYPNYLISINTFNPNNYALRFKEKANSYTDGHAPIGFYYSTDRYCSVSLNPESGGRAWDWGIHKDSGVLGDSGDDGVLSKTVYYIIDLYKTNITNYQMVLDNIVKGNAAVINEPSKHNVGFSCWDNDNNWRYYVDWIIVRKYVVNHPIYVLGNAETYTPPPLTPPSKPSFTEIDLIDQLHHEYTHIEPETMHIPIYTGLNYISIPLYQYNTSLNAVFGDNPVTDDKISHYINGVGYENAQYCEGYGWYGDVNSIEPIEPCIGYEYNRTGDNFTLNVSGYMKYNITIFNYENRVGANIIRPMRSDKDD